jgi:uncharacterized protein (TIGR04141 family)
MATEKRLPVTVFLIKADMVAEFEKALTSWSDVQAVTISTPFAAEVAVIPGTDRQPPWVVTLGLNRRAALAPALLSRAPSALAVVRVKTRTFVLTFGGAWQRLDLAWVEPDFGLKVVLNSVPPEAVVEVKAQQVLAQWHLASERAPRASSVRRFGVEFDRDLVAVIEGEPKHAILGKRARGGTSLHVKVAPAKIPEMLRTATILFGKVDYRKAWPDVDNFRESKDAELIAAAEAALDGQMALNGWKDAVLFTPAERRGEAVEVHSYVYGNLSGTPAHSPYLMAQSWIDHLALRDRKPSVAISKTTHIHTFDAGREHIQRATVFECLGAEVSVAGRTLVLSEGKWFEVAENFAERVHNGVMSLERPSVVLPRWNGKKDEAAFNEAAAKAVKGVNCDARLIGFGGGRSRVEFCDVLHLPSRTLYFVKIASRSSGMSHLLEQVRRTAELFFGTDGVYRPKVAGALLQAYPKGDVGWLDEKPKRDEWTLCLVSMGRAAADLPFFAKAGLYRLVTSLDSAGYRVRFLDV